MRGRRARRSRTSPSATRRRARRVAGLLDEVFAQRAGTQFAVSEYELSGRLDVRPLVLKTILTYLELDGLLRQGTPFYAGYSFRPLDATSSFDDVFAAFDAGAGRLPAAARGERQDAAARWTSLDPDEAAAALGRGAQPDRRRARLTSRSRGSIELRASDARQRYTVARAPDLAATSCSTGSSSGSSAASSAEVERIARVVSLVTHDGCQVNALVGYFGEMRAEPCGHCSFCLAGRRAAASRGRGTAAARDRRRPAMRSLPSPARNPMRSGARGSGRASCAGITSPATTRAKLTRDPLFGATSDRRFSEVLAWTTA